METTRNTNSNSSYMRLTVHLNGPSVQFNKFNDYEANTIVVWNGLYKFEKYLKEGSRENALKKEINEITADYLSLVFHRFMERTNNPLKIRINNIQVKPFNPFPEGDIKH